MSAKKPALQRSLTSDLARVDAHTIGKDEYDELPEVDEQMLARARVNRGGRPIATNPRKLLSIRLPSDVIDRWIGSVQQVRNPALAGPASWRLAHLSSDLSPNLLLKGCEVQERLRCSLKMLYCL
jgi:uncharacterized protein (DUF4415 family)